MIQSEDADTGVLAKLHALEQKRMAEGLCRHCGGPVPCYSIFGDGEIGKKHTRDTLQRTIEERKHRFKKQYLADEDI